MIAAGRPDHAAMRLFTVDADGVTRKRPRSDLGTLFEPDDLVVANDAATLPASLHGRHERSGETIEVRLAGWIDAEDPTRFLAVVFGAGDYRVRTENRPAPPKLNEGDRLNLGPLTAFIEALADHPRLVVLQFDADADADADAASIYTGLAQHGRPIQYAHVPAPLALWDVWTRIAAKPVAFEAPSAGFALDWATIAAWRRRGIGFVTLTLAAGISSTGDPALDRRMPFDEPYRIPVGTANAILSTKEAGGRIIAVGTTVVRALEAAARADGGLAGEGIATGRITRSTSLRVVNSILTGVHQPGESHYELLRAFADDTVLDRMAAGMIVHGARNHEFGDTVLIERRACEAVAGQVRECA